MDKPVGQSLIGSRDFTRAAMKAENFFKALERIGEMLPVMKKLGMLSNRNPTKKDSNLKPFK